MQRDIKFRAWNNIFNRFAPDHAEYHFGGENPHLYFDVFNGNFDTDVWDFSECTLMQFTGLKDKNGVEIYEGDIVKCQPRGIKDLGIFTVKYDHVYGSYVLIFNKWCGLNVSSPENYPLGEGRFDIEVIGNIYENPELINS